MILTDAERLEIRHTFAVKADTARMERERLIRECDAAIEPVAKDHLTKLVDRFDERVGFYQDIVDKMFTDDLGRTN